MNIFDGLHVAPAGALARNANAGLSLKIRHLERRCRLQGRKDFKKKPAEFTCRSGRLGKFETPSPGLPLSMKRRGSGHGRLQERRGLVGVDVLHDVEGRSAPLALILDVHHLPANLPARGVAGDHALFGPSHIGGGTRGGGGGNG